MTERLYLLINIFFISQNWLQSSSPVYFREEESLCFYSSSFLIEIFRNICQFWSSNFSSDLHHILPEPFQEHQQRDQTSCENCLEGLEICYLQKCWALDCLDRIFSMGLLRWEDQWETAQKCGTRWWLVETRTTLETVRNERKGDWPWPLRQDGGFPLYHLSW